MTEPTTNPYAMPSSALHDAPTSSQAPSIDEALSRGYDFSIGALISESWSLVKGTKGLIFAGLLIFYAVTFAGTFAVTLLLSSMGLMGAAESTSFLIFNQIISMLITSAAYPFMAGIYMVGIRRAANQPVTFDLIFSQFGKFLPLLILAMLMTLLMILGYLLLIIPGIYLSVAYGLAIPLMAERNLSPWQAMETSRKAIHQHWFKIFGLYIVLGVILLVSVIPVGIGLIWSLPLFILAFGVLYRTIFGVLPATN